MDPLDRLANDLRDRVEALPERERRMMRLRLGYADGRQWTLREIARELDTDRDEVRRVERELLGG